MTAARLRVGRGARATEELLLRDLEELLPGSPGELVAGPIRVLVPSRSLRLHLAAELLRRRGRAVVGLELHTLRGLALALLDASGARAPRGAALLPAVVREAARPEDSLRSIVDGAEQGWRTVVATVRELLDAGLEGPVEEALDERLAELSPRLGTAATERARALVRTAARAGSRADSLGLATSSALLRAAAELVAVDPASVLEARALLVHGFADATGLATDFLEALLRHPGARLYLDRPPDPAHPEADDLGLAFARRFVERVAPGALSVVPDAEPASAPVLATFHAPGASAEVAEVARRARALLDEGVPAERIGLVARRLEPYRLPLRRELGALGLAFSGLGEAGMPSELDRRLGALGELLRLGERAPISTWLEACGRTGDRVGIALHALGRGRLEQLAGLDLAVEMERRGDGERFALPLRTGLAVWEDEGGGGTRRGAPRWKLAPAMITEALRAADRVRSLLRELPTAAGAAGAQLEVVQRLLAELGFSRAREEERPVLAALDELRAELAPELPVQHDDLRELLSEAFSALGRHPFGGRGGGLCVLSVIEARARTFEHLFLLGMGRESFPRVVREDPLLPDRLREPLRAVLPDLPLKLGGYDEERYLFAQLLSSSPNVTLSWPSSDEEGQALSPSPLAERLRLVRGDDRPAAVRHRSSPPSRPEAEERPAREQAVIAGLHGDRRSFAAMLPAAVSEAARALGGSGLGRAESEALARARLAVLAELDPDRSTAEGNLVRASLGPWFGFVGPVIEAADPRREPASVSRVQDAARCPWQHFLAGVLRLEPLPDPAGRLPELPRQLVGLVVHAVLERAVGESLGVERRELAAALAAGAIPVARPDDARLSRLVDEEVAIHCAKAGLTLGGLARVLANSARELLAEALAADWPRPGATRPVLGVELAGVARIATPAGGARAVSFRTDRVDQGEDGPVLIDYKTGRPPSRRRSPNRRRADLLKEVRRGRMLQAAVYAAGAGAEGARGRFVFLRPELSPEERRYDVHVTDEDFAEALAAVVGEVATARDAGVLFPRLTKTDGEKEPQACQWCRVAECCLRGDSGARQRLADWTRRRRGERAEGRERLGAEESVLLDLWLLGHEPGPPP